MLSPEELEELEILEQLEIKQAQESLLNFITATNENYTVKWYHVEICKWIDKLLKREIKKLMIFLPPQHGKSEISSRITPAYALGKNPKEKIILMSYNKTKASEFCRDSKRIMKSEKYQEIFPEVEINGIDRSDFFEVNDGSGFYKSVGMDSGVTGTTGTLGIIDDPFKGRNDATSDAIREAVWKTYQDDFLTRLNNDSSILMLFTRWHEDDIAGRLLDPNNEHYDEEEASEWTVIAIPALKEATKPLECALDLPDPRQIDEALWPEKHSAEKYIKRRRTNPIGFNSLDQQRPSAVEGNMIKKEWWVIKDKNQLPFAIDHVTWNFVIDGAYTDDTENDASAQCAYYFHKPTGELYFRNVCDVRMNLPEYLNFFNTWSRANGKKNNSITKVELKASGHSMKQFLRFPKYGGHNAVGVSNKFVSMGKHNRVETCSPYILSGKVILISGSWNDAFIDQCGKFPNGTHDDMLDVGCYAILDTLHVNEIHGKKSGVSTGD